MVCQGGAIQCFHRVLARMGRCGGGICQYLKARILGQVVDIHRLVSASGPISAVHKEDIERYVGGGVCIAFSVLRRRYKTCFDALSPHKSHLLISPLVEGSPSNSDGRLGRGYA